jgi:hypothetical protein
VSVPASSEDLLSELHPGDIIVRMSHSEAGQVKLAFAGQRQPAHPHRWLGPNVAGRETVPGPWWPGTAGRDRRAQQLRVRYKARWRFLMPAAQGGSVCV